MLLQHHSYASGGYLVCTAGAADLVVRPLTSRASIAQLLLQKGQATTKRLQLEQF